MAVKGKGKQVAAESPGPGAGGASGSGGKRRKTSGAGPSSSSAAKRRRRSGVLQFVDDVAGVDDDYEEEELEEDELELDSEDDPDDGFFTGGEHVQNLSNKRTERSHPLPFLVKEEELSGDELEEFIKNRYSNRVKYAADQSYSREDDDIFPMDCALKEPTIWKVKCMVGRERQMAFCFMQKFIDVGRIGTKLPIITAFALDHIRGFVFVEAAKACDVTEVCKGFCSVYVSRITSVPAAEVPSLLSSRTKPLVISRGTWVRMKNGNYKGDLAQVVSMDDGRKKVMIKIIPRVDLHAISKKFGGAVSLREAAVPAPRLISSQELDIFRPHIVNKRDRETGEVFEVLDGLMFKDGFLYKKVALSSLIYWGIQPTETELLKFSSSPSNRASADDLDWLSGMYGSKKRNLPADRDMKSSSSKIKSSKASDLKASTSTENYDDNDEFNIHDLVLYGQKDFGVIIAVEKDGFRILKGCPEGSAVTVRKQDIKKVCIDKMFTAVDHHKKTISINDTVNVVEGSFQGKQGVVKHLYLGILFIYNESETENCGFFCAQSGSCEKIRKGLGSSTTESSDFPTPMFSEPTYEQNEHRDTERPYRSTREQLFSIGQMLRIRKGPLKGYLCRVVRIFRNDVTVKLDSLLKTVTVQADLLSVPANRGDNSSGAPASKFGSQDTSFFGSEAGKTSWDNGLPSFGSDSWQPFSSSTLPVQNAGAESEADPWCKKTSAEDDSDAWGKKPDGDSNPWGKEAGPSAAGVSDPWGKNVASSADGDSDPWGKKVVSSADGDSDPWGKKVTSSAVEVWNTGATQQEGSSGSAWDKQAGVGGSDAAGSSWDRAVVNKEIEKSDNWGEACRVKDTGTGADTDPWGSKVKAVDMEGSNSWEKATVPPDSKLEDVSQGWGQPKGNSTEDQTKDNVSKDVDNNRAWGSSSHVTEDGTWGKSKDNSCDGAGGAGGWDASAAKWNKSSLVADAQDEGWGKGTSNDIGNWDKPGALDQGGDSNWGKPKSFGGDGWNKGDDQNSSWNRPGNFGGGRGFGRGQGRGRGQESGDSNGRNDQGSWKNSWGGGNAERPSWRSDNQVDNEAGDSGGYRGRGRGGRGQYGRRGRGRDNGWRNGDGSDSVFGRENNSGDGPKWGGGGNWNTTNPPNNQPWSSSGGTKPSTWNNSEDNKSSGEQGDPWASKVSSTEGKEQQNDPWSSKMTSGGTEDTNGGWDTKAKDSSCNDGGGLQNDPWANKIGSNEGKEEADPWASKTSSAVGADDKNGSWNMTAKGTPSKEKADDPWTSKGVNDDSKKTDTWGAGSSSGNQGSWSKPNFSLGDQEPTWSNSRFGDDDNGNNRGGFGRGNRGRGRGRNFGDGGGSSWNGGNRNDESGGGRSGEPWNRRDFDGGRGRGRGRFGRGDRNQGNNFGSGDGGSWGSGRGDGGSWGSGRGDGGSWGSGRGDGGSWGSGSGRGDGGSWGSGRGNGGRGQGGGWSQSSDWNANKGSGNSKPSWEAHNTSGGDDQAGKSDANNSWSQNRSSTSILGQPSGGSWGSGRGDGGSWGSGRGDGGSWGSGRGNGSSWGSGSGRGDGGSWGSGRGNGGRGQGGGWSQSSDWNANKGSGNSKPSWEAQNTSGGDDQAGKSDANNSWSQNRSSTSILGQPSGDANKSNAWGAPSGGASGGGSWGKSNEDGWNSSGGSAKEKPSWGGGSEAPAKKEDDPWGKGGGGSGSQGGGGGSSWDKAADGGNKGTGSGGW